MATLKRAICDKKWLAMLPFLPFVALTETTNGPFMSCLLGCYGPLLQSAWRRTVKSAAVNQTNVSNAKRAIKRTRKDDVVCI